MDRKQFSKLKVGDRLHLTGVGEVEVTSIERKIDWAAWNAAGTPALQSNRYQLTCAVEVSSGHLIKIDDPKEWMAHIRRID